MNRKVYFDIGDGIKRKVLNKRKVGKFVHFEIEGVGRILKDQIAIAYIQCELCDRIDESMNAIVIFTREKQYFCNKCRLTGEKNPFYGKSWHAAVSTNLLEKGENPDEFFENYSRDKSSRYIGENNPMYGKPIYEAWVERYGEEIANKKLEEYRKKMASTVSGEKNGFYGKIHTDETKQKIIESNRENRKRNAKEILKKKLITNKLTYEVLEEAISKYQNDYSFSLEDLAAFCNVDQRTAVSIASDLGIIGESEFRKIASDKRLKYRISKPERELKNILVQEFGEENVIHQFNLERKFYDFLLFKKLLVEYDGYYWHVEFNILNRDAVKNEIALKNGYSLYRIKEDASRNVCFETELIKIKEKLHEIQAKEN